MNRSSAVGWQRARLWARPRWTASRSDALRLIRHGASSASAMWGACSTWISRTAAIASRRRRRPAARRRRLTRPAERVAKRVGRLAGRTERQSLCLEVGVFGGQVEERAVHGAILGEPFAELVQEPGFVAIAQRLQCRAQRLRVPLDGGGACSASRTNAAEASSVSAITARLPASADFVNCTSRSAGETAALDQALQRGVGGDAAAGAGCAQQKDGDDMARGPEIAARAQGVRHVRDRRTDSRPRAR